MKLYKSLILFAAPALLLGSCSENSWNDHLDGFQTPGAASGTTTASYTLTSADYAAIPTLAANKALAEANGETDELNAIASGTFVNDDQARKYIPALLASSDKGLPYFTYNNGSSLKVSYNVLTELPEKVQAVNRGVEKLTISEAEYKMVWDSEENYINAFAPSHPAIEFVPELLSDKFDDLMAGDVVIVNYNESSVNPVFTSGGGSGGGEIAGPTWSETSVIGSATLDQKIQIHGVVTAICSRGFIISDASGSILCYQSSGFDQNAIPMYSKVIVNGTVSAYNSGLQIAITNESYDVVGEGAYTYPSPVKVNGAAMDAAIAQTDNFLARYVEFTGTVSISGNYYNIYVDGAETAIGSLYMTPDYIKAMIEDGNRYTFTGYFNAISGGKYYNLVCTDVTSPGTVSLRHDVKRAPASSISVNPAVAIYQKASSGWAPMSGVSILSDADYKAMGLSYSNLSGTQPDTYLPLYCNANFPYAVEGDSHIVAYLYYANGVSNYMAREYVKTNGEWVINAGLSSSQFSKAENEWKYNPSVIVDLPYSRNTDPSYTYYMTCVEWVFENISKKIDPNCTLTAAKGEAAPFLDYRGNAEFYSGASAYYGNVDVRASSAKNNAPKDYTGYDGMTDDEITLLLKKRFSTEVMPAALSILHSDMKPSADMEVTLTLNFSAYFDDKEIRCQIIYEVTAPATFTYRSSTWVEEGQDADW